MNKTTKVATATAGIIAIAWMFAKRVSKKTTILVIPQDILDVPEKMSTYNQRLFKLILDDFRKVYDEEKAKGNVIVVLNPFGKDVTRLFEEVLRKHK